jgi:hypothetical protein
MVPAAPQGAALSSSKVAASLELAQADGDLSTTRARNASKTSDLMPPILPFGMT